MKQSFGGYVEIELEGVDVTTLDRVEMVFRQYEGDGAVKSAVWKSDGTGDCLEDHGLILVPWTREDTTRFAPGAQIWLDVRPTTSGGQDLETDLIELRMNPSLFREASA